MPFSRGTLSRLRERKASLAISLAVILLALFLYVTTFLGERPTAAFRFLHRLEMASLDLRFQVRGRVAPDPRIMIVDIDQRSQEVLGRWPFPRSHFATLLDVLRDDGAGVVAFDVTFSQPDDTAKLMATIEARLLNQRRGARSDATLRSELERIRREYDHDRRFAEAVARFGRVVLGNFFLYTEADLRGLDAASLDRYAELVAYFPFPQVRPTASARGAESYRAMVQHFADLDLVPRGAEANLEILTQALGEGGGSTGFFNVFPDPDGVVRRIPLAIPYGRGNDFADYDLYASLEVQAVRAFLGLSEQQTVLNFGATGIESIELGDLRTRPDEMGRVLVNYRGPARTFPYVSLADVVQRKFAPGTFRDKLVLVGASATGIGDLRATPYGTLDFPGVEIHANAIDNVLHAAFLHRSANQAVADLALIFLLGVPVGLWLALTRPRAMFLALFLLLPFAAGVQWAFNRGWLLNATVPALFTLVPNVALVSVYRVLVEEREKRKVRGAFQHYLSGEVIERLLENPRLVEPRKTEISVLFSDIRGFTTISEQLDAQELALFLNGYLTDMTGIIFRHRGTLDKYIGDAIMAFWGAPSEEPRHAEQACHAALTMIARLRELQRQWAAEGKPPIDIGVGINTGVASVGNMGSELRYGYTAMGDTVNLASRLEALTREYNTHILLTESTYAAVRQGSFLVRELDLIRVKGKTQPVVIYDLLAVGDVFPFEILNLKSQTTNAQSPAGSPADARLPAGSARKRTSPSGISHLKSQMSDVGSPLASPEEAASLEQLVAAFAAARTLYKRRLWREAKTAFDRILERWPADGPSQLFSRRNEEYLRNEPAADWDGVFVMKHK